MVTIKEALSYGAEIKGFEVTGRFIKSYPVQERKGYFFQDIEVEDDTSTAKVSISFGQEVPENAITPSLEPGTLIKCTKCGINVWKDKKSIKTSHFEVGGRDIPKTSESPEKPPLNAKNEASGKASEQEMWDGKERRSIRGMAVSYAKDLCVSGKINIPDIVLIAQEMVDFIYENNDKENKVNSGVDSKDMEVPF